MNISSFGLSSYPTLSLDGMKGKTPRELPTLGEGLSLSPPSVAVVNNELKSSCFSPESSPAESHRYFGLYMDLQGMGPGKVGKMVERLRDTVTRKKEEIAGLEAALAQAADKNSSKALQYKLDEANFDLLVLTDSGSSVNQHIKGAIRMELSMMRLAAMYQPGYCGEEASKAVEEYKAGIGSMLGATFDKNSFGGYIDKLYQITSKFAPLQKEICRQAIKDGILMASLDTYA